MAVPETVLIRATLDSVRSALDDLYADLDRMEHNLQVRESVANPAFMTLAEAADALRIHAQTAKVWALEGRLPSVKVGHRVRVPRKAVEALLEAATASGMTR